MEEVPLELGLEGSVGVQRAVSGAKKSEVGVRRSEQNSCGERDVWGRQGPWQEELRSKAMAPGPEGEGLWRPQDE